MQNTNDGGPAFPSATSRYDSYRNLQVFAEGGMSLRDYFAAKAMGALIPLCVQGDPEGWKTDIAKTAYNFSDAMLRARESKDT